MYRIAQMSRRMGQWFRRLFSAGFVLERDDLPVLSKDDAIEYAKEYLAPLEAPAPDFCYAVTVP